MRRGTYRFREFTVLPDTEPDAEPSTHAAPCAVCGESGPVGRTWDEASGWILRHVGAHPEHFTYRSLVTLPYRVVPGEWR